MSSIWVLIIMVQVSDTSQMASNGVRYKSNGVRYKSNGVRIEVIFVSIDFHTRLSNTYAYPDPPNMNDLFSFVKVYSIGLSTITLLICQHRFRDRSRMR
jgi:hypothetical protein